MQLGYEPSRSSVLNVAKTHIRLQCRLYMCLDCARITLNLNVVYTIFEEHLLFKVLVHNLGPCILWALAWRCVSISMHLQIDVCFFLSQLSILFCNCETAFLGKGSFDDKFNASDSDSSHFGVHSSVFVLLVLVAWLMEFICNSSSLTTVAVLLSIYFLVARVVLQRV